MEGCLKIAYKFLHLRAELKYNITNISINIIEANPGIPSLLSPT